MPVSVIGTTRTRATSTNHIPRTCLRSSSSMTSRPSTECGRGPTIPPSPCLTPCLKAVQMGNENTPRSGLGFQSALAPPEHRVPPRSEEKRRACDHVEQAYYRDLRFDRKFSKYAFAEKELHGFCLHGRRPEARQRSSLRRGLCIARWGSGRG